jgi:hypothetical protein
MRLLASDTESPRESNMDCICHKSGVMGLILGACLILLCLVLLVLQSMGNIMEATIKSKMATHVMMLWKYKSLDQDDAF